MTTPTQERPTQRTGEASPPVAARRKRKVPAPTAPRLQPKTLLAATRDEMQDIQAELELLATERCQLLDQDKRGTKSSIKLLPAKA